MRDHALFGMGASRRVAPVPSGLFIAEVIGCRIGARIAKRRESCRIRRNREAHRAGRTVTFPGWALGEAAYCPRPSEGFLTVWAELKRPLTEGPS